MCDGFQNQSSWPNDFFRGWPEVICSVPFFQSTSICAASPSREPDVTIKPPLRTVRASFPAHGSSPHQSIAFLILQAFGSLVLKHVYQVVVLMRAPVGLMLDMVDVPPGLFIDKKHLCCKSSGWRWIFLPGGAALDEAVQDREQLTQHSDQSFYGFSSGS